MVPNISRLTAFEQLPKIDVKNQKILQALARDGRISGADLARQLRLSRDAVSYRINKLAEEGVLLAVVPIIDLQKFNQTVFHAFFLLDEKAHSRHTSFTDCLISHKNTVSVMQYTDTWDLEWVFVAPDLLSCDSLLQQVTNQYADVLLEKEVLAEVRKYIHRQLPGQEHAQKTAKAPGSVLLDKKDLALLQELGHEARQSSYALAKKLRVSPDTVLYRTRKLMDRGIIKGFTGVYSLAKLGYAWYTYAIRFDRFTSSDEARFAECVQQNPNILCAAKVFGKWDVLLTLVAENPQQYHALVKKIKNAFAETIVSYQTWLANEEIVYFPVPRVLIEQ